MFRLLFRELSNLVGQRSMKPSPSGWTVHLSNLNTEMRFESEWGTNRRKKKGWGHNKWPEAVRHGRTSANHRWTKIKFMFMFFPIWFGKSENRTRRRSRTNIRATVLRVEKRTTIHRRWHRHDKTLLAKPLNNDCFLFYEAYFNELHSHHLSRPSEYFHSALYVTHLFVSRRFSSNESHSSTQWCSECHRRQ